MTAREHHGKPRYIDINGLAEPVDLTSCQPPFVFREVTARVFPIRANMARLYGFCDQYLNLDIPHALVNFRPALPYVYLMVINYGSMAAESVRAQNLGWVAQREVTFTVPLERWEQDPVTGRWRFTDWALVSPFIFVDDEMSLTTGREVYGWPKVAAQVDADVPLWANDPRAPTRLFCLSTPVFPRLYGGAREELRDLIQIDRDSVPRFSEIPPDPANPWLPLAILTGAARNSLGLLGDAADMLLRSRVRGYRHGWDPVSLLMMSRVALRNFSALLPGLGAMRPAALRGPLSPLLGEPVEPPRPGHGDAPLRGTGIDMVTLKQFRDAADPSQACYQALVRSRMTIERLNRCGLLGDYNLLRGDPSGGYAIRVHRYPAQPIVECLGLEVARTEDGQEAPVAILKPTFPFWTDVDLHYGVGETVCWRAQCAHSDARCTAWHRDGALPHTGDPSAPLRMPYNTLQGAATQAVTGPFHFPDVTLQVYPLPATRTALATFLDEYLNRALASGEAGAPRYEYRFEPFGRYVYLLVSVLGDQAGLMWSETNNIGWWADKEVSFCVPVRRYRRMLHAGSEASGGSDATSAWEFMELGVVSPFIFANSGRAVITDRETSGRPSVKADIDSPRDPWLSPLGPIAKRHFLQVETETFPALFVGQRAERSTVLEICEQHVAPPGLPRAAALPAHHIHVRSWLRNGLPDTDQPPDDAGSTRTRVNRFHLKQYRDAQQPTQACYQALVLTPRYVTRLLELGAIDQPVQVRLTMTPGYPIVTTLGLKVKAVESTAAGVQQIIEPSRPFWLRASLREDLGRVLCWRTHAGEWAPGTPP